MIVLAMMVFVLSLVGLWISIYFTGIFYQWFKPNVFWMPMVCQLKEATCMNVLGTPRAKIFGVPNSAFGIGIYTYILLDLFWFPGTIGLVLLGMALFRSIYLAYSLLFVTKIPCPLCFTSHGINLTLFLIYGTLTFFPS